jgi:hypothetical protein
MPVSKILQSMNPGDINIADYYSKEDEDVLVVPHAGEMLYRLSSGYIPTITEQ